MASLPLVWPLVNILRISRLPVPDSTSGKEGDGKSDKEVVGGETAAYAGERLDPEKGNWASELLSRHLGAYFV